MEKAQLVRWSQIEDGMMGRFELECGMPINVCVDNYDEISIKDQDTCELEIFGVGQNLQIFKSEEELYASGSRMAAESLIPTGTFPASGDEEEFEESPEILFTGRIVEVDFDPEAKEHQPNVQMRIQTFGMEFIVYWRTDAAVEAGYIVYGGAWLYGDAHQ